MKMCGGSGKHADIPPREYIPHSFVVDDIKCGKCLKIYETGNDVKMHVLDEHKRGVKKAFAMQALEMVDKVVTVDEVFTVNAVVTVDTGHVEVVVVDVVTGRAPLTAKKNRSNEDRL